MVHVVATEVFTSNYLKQIAFNYTLAVGINDAGANNYKGFNSFIEYSQFLELSKLIPCRRCLFEVIKTKHHVKPYFDIDKSNMTTDEYKIFIEQFIISFNHFFSSSITMNDTLIYFRDDNDKKNIVSSSHLIVNNCKITYSHIKKFVKYYELLYDIKIFDSAIYSHHRLFNLPFNTKLKYILKDSQNPKYFIPFKEQSNTVKDYTISYIDDIKTEPLKLNKGFAIYELIQDKLINTLKQAFKKLKHAETVQSSNISVPLVYITNIIELFDLFVIHLPIAFYQDDNNKEWLKLTRLFKKYNLDKAKVSIWCRICSLNNTKWTETEIQKYYKKLTITDLWFGIPTFKAIFNKYIHMEIKTNNNKPLIDYIYSIIYKDDQCEDKEAYAELADIVAKNKTFYNNKINSLTFDLSKATDGLTNGYSYNFNTGFLYFNNKIVSSYYIDIELKKEYLDSKNETDVLIEDITEMTEITSNFFKNEESVLACKAKWGSGKTHIIVRTAINECKKINKRVIILTENNALNRKFCVDFGFISHIGNDELDHTQNIACSTESISKIKYDDDPLIILDEYETLINHFESDTFKNKAFEKFDIFKNIIKNTTKIIVLDADLSTKRLDLIKHIKETKFNMYDVKTNNFMDYSFNLILDSQSFINKILIEADTKRLIIPSSSKSFNKRILCDINNRNKKLNILKVDGEDVIMIKDGVQSIINRLEMDRCEQFITDNKIDIFLYSPSIKTGVSLNVEYFEKCYGYGYNTSTCVREFIQMLFRARTLKAKEINICLNTSLTRIRQNVELDRVNHYLLKPLQLFYTLNIFNGSYGDHEKKVCDTTFTIDKAFLEMKTINLHENYNSQTRYTQEFLTKIVYSHNIKINYIDEIIEIEEFVGDGEAIVLTDRTINEFVNCDLVNFEEHGKLKENDWLKKQKYYLFKSLYYINGVTDSYDYDTEAYDKVNNDEFYIKYNDETIRKKYIKIKKIINKTIDDVKIESDYFINEGHTVSNRLNGREAKIAEQTIIISVLEALKINLNTLPIKVTNTELNESITEFNNSSMLIELRNYYKNFKLEHKFIFEYENKNYINNMKKVIEDLLEKIDITFKYVNKHTAGKNDKIIFNFKHFETKKPSISEFKTVGNFAKIKEELVKKTRNTFTYEDSKNCITKCYKTKDKYITDGGNVINYFNTYAVNINSFTKQLRDRIIPQSELCENLQVETKLKDLHDTTILKELKHYFKLRLRPLIISDYDYKLKQEQIITDKLGDCEELDH
jgi:hypothetical protein